MRPYILDTNLYIAAARSEERAGDLANFTSAALPALYLHSVVVQELLAGAVSGTGKREIIRSVIKPFEKRGRILVPSYRAWKRSGEIVCELVVQHEMSAGGFSRSFMNDALIAADRKSVV